MKILIADNEKLSQAAIKRTLEKEKYEIEVCDSGKKAIEIIKNDKDIRIVIPGSLTDTDMVSLCREIRELKQSRYIYIILNLSDNSELNKVREAGADDFISKPFDNNVFLIRIKNGLRLIETEDKFVKSQKELIKLVKEDPLTTLLNRRAFLDEAVKEIDRAARENQVISGILVDIDDFKQINESYGDFTGDRVLTEFANRLRLGCRPYDILGRYAGEEFIVLLPNTKANNAVKVAKRLRASIAKKFYDVQGHSIKLSASFGISSIVPDIGLKDNQVEMLIKKTVIALTKAKKEGAERIAINADV